MSWPPEPVHVLPYMAAGLGRCDQAKDFETERPLCSTGVGQIVTGVLIRGEEEIRDRQTERQREDAVLLVLKVEEKGPSLGMQVVSRSGKETDSPQVPSEGTQPCRPTVGLWKDETLNLCSLRLLS